MKKKRKYDGSKDNLESSTDSNILEVQLKNGEDEIVENSDE